MTSSAISSRKLLDACDLLRELFYSWTLWEEHEAYYVENLLPKLQADPQSGEQHEQAILRQIVELLSADQWNDLPALGRVVARTRRQRNELRKQLLALLQARELKRADDFVQEHLGLLNFSDYTALREDYATLPRPPTTKPAAPAAERSDEDTAVPPSVAYPAVGNFVERTFGIHLDHEQASALDTTARHTLVRARAGSGKTRVLTCKAAVLIRRDGIDPGRLLLLAFNASAAELMKDRLRNRCGIPELENARTFHSLAYQLVQPAETLLFNQGMEPSEQKFSLFVQKIWKSLWNEDLRERMYGALRRELNEIEDAGIHLTEAEYLVYRRNHTDVALAGHVVKSQGEKYIADFLFEHGLDYWYEPTVYWNGRVYHPDFKLKVDRRYLILEHWGIDERDPESRTPRHWKKSREDYLLEMQRKRAHWAGKPEKLLETSVRDLREGRAAFEAILKRRLENVGVRCERLPEQELQQRVERKHVARITTMLTQFLQKAKKRCWSPDEAASRVAKHAAADERTRVFLELAVSVYGEYERRLACSGNIDFDILLERAVALIHRTRGECSIPLRDRRVPLNELTWILIDEYQDFSEQFSAIIEAIRTYNPGVRLFCVGDDWQAINGFAGSDPTFFRRFRESHEDATYVDLLTNYRSTTAIIDSGNQVMNGCGAPSRAADGAGPGYIEIADATKVWIEERRSDDHGEERARDTRFCVKGAVDRQMAARYLKLIHSFVTDPENVGRKTVVLSRTRALFGVKLDSYSACLRACLSPEEVGAIGSFDEMIQFRTVHRYKGSEAEVVILLRVCERTFPLIHADNSLYAVFGETEQSVLDEERRLFYVAITRAEQRIYIITEEDSESPYLSGLKERARHLQDIAF